MLQLLVWISRVIVGTHFPHQCLFGTLLGLNFAKVYKHDHLYLRVCSHQDCIQEKFLDEDVKTWSIVHPHIHVHIYYDNPFRFTDS